MKKILFIVMAALTIGCGDGSNNSSQGKAGDAEQNESLPAESDGSIHSDTTTTGGNNSQNQYDTLK